MDFADIRAVMESAGSALMGIGLASGENRAQAAARAAISSPLLEISINGAKGVLFAIAGGDDLGMLEVQEAAKTITESIDPNAKVIFGAIKDDKLKKNEVKVTVIATGFPAGSFKAPSAPLFSAVKEREERGKIFNSMPTREENEEVKTPPLTPPLEEKTAPKAKDDDDEWGAVPSFLRRPKLK